MNNYEKKYKEALAKARRLHDEPTGGTERIVCEQIFPELMGSEDERIRKWLEEHIEAMPYNSIEFKDVKRIDVLYWLEMQGEQKFSDGTFVNVDDVREDFVNEVYRVLDADSTNDRANQIIDAFDNLPTIELEKQCEQMPADKVEPKFKVGDTMRTLQEAKDGRTDGMPFVVSIDSEYYNCNSEKIAIKDQDDYEYPPMNRKQKPAEEYNITGIGSKNAQGKLGEMIKRKLEMDKQSDKTQSKSAIEAIKEEKVNNQFCIKPADKVEPKDYSSIDPHFGKSIDKIEPKFHEGDWVVNRFGDVWHIDSVDKKNYQVSDEKGNYNYFPISKQDEMHLWTIQDAKAGDILVCKGNVKNSNEIKYERICLFNTLDNAFFTLTKTSNYVEECGINVNIDYPDGTIPATKEQKEILFMAMADAGYTFDFEKKELKRIENEIEIPFGAKDSELQEDTYYIPKGFHAEIDEDKVVIKKGEKPTEWSEEDEYCKHQLIVFCENCMVQDSSAKRCTNWLKSLKYRVGCEANCTTTKKWKPSDEQMVALNNAILLNEDHYNGAVLSTLREQLMKLK